MNIVLLTQDSWHSNNDISAIRLIDMVFSIE